MIPAKEDLNAAMFEGTTRRRHESGFSLLELLVILTIIGIIAVIAVGAVTNQIDKARVVAVATDLRTFEAGFLLYHADTGTFPPDSHLDPHIVAAFNELWEEGVIGRIADEINEEGAQEQLPLDRVA